MSTSQFTLIDTRIRQEAQGRHCLNDLHKAAVAQGANKRATEPGKFFRSPRIQELVRLLEVESDTPIWGTPIPQIGVPPLRQIGVPPIVVLNDGVNNGTYVCIQLVIAYGQFVSAAFDLKVINTFLGVIHGEHAMPHIQSTKFWDTTRPHWAGVAQLALAGLKNKQIAQHVDRSAASVGACLRRMAVVGYLNPVEVFKARLKPVTAARWAIQKPLASTWGKPVNNIQLPLFAETNITGEKV